MPGVTVGVYEGQLDAGTEVSSTYEGRHLTVREDELIHPYHADGFVDKGEPVVLCDAGVPTTYGAAVGVVFKSGAAAADLIALDTEGIFNLTVYAEDDDGNAAIEIGDPLYIRAGNLPGAADGDGTGDGEISKISAAAWHVFFGYALGSLGSGGTGVIAVKVHYDPRIETALEVRGTPGDGIVFCSVGNSTNPLAYAAASDVASEIWATITLATSGGFYGLESDVLYDPATTGWATPVGIVGRVTLNDAKTHTGGQAGMEGVRGHIAFNNTATLNSANSIYCGIRAVITATGTPVFTDYGGLSCIYCDNLCAIDMAGLSSYEFGSCLISAQNHGGTMDHAISLRGGNKITNVFHFDTFGGGAIDAGTKGGAGTHMRILVDNVTKYINIYGG